MNRPLGRCVLFFYEGYIGVQPTVANLAKAMGHAGYDVTVYIPPTAAPDVGDLGDGVRIEHLRPRPILERIGEVGFGRYRLKKVFARLIPHEASFALRGAYREVQSRLRDSRRTVYVGVDANGAAAALLCAWLLRRSYIFVSLELKAMERLHGTLRGVFARLVYRKAAAVTVQGLDRLEILIRELRWTHRNVFILPNSPFADEGESRQAANGLAMRAKWGIASTRRIALQAGMINDGTCAKDLAKGFSGLSDWALVLHERLKRSPDEPDLAHLREINPDNLCLSLDPVPYDQVDGIFAAADVGLAFYQPSGPTDVNFRFISSSGKLPHYLKYGKPILVSNLPPLVEVVEAFECGFVINDPSDRHEIASALDQVRARYAELSRNALRCFSERYDFGKSAAALTRFMNDLRG